MYYAELFYADETGQLKEKLQGENLGEDFDRIFLYITWIMALGPRLEQGIIFKPVSELTSNQIGDVFYV